MAGKAQKLGSGYRKFVLPGFVRFDSTERFEHVVVEAFVCQKLLVSTHFNYSTVLQSQDTISARDRGQPVSND